MKLNNDAVRAVLIYIENNIKYKPGGTFEHDKYLTQYDIVNGVKSFPEFTKDDVRYAIEQLLHTNYLDLIGNPVYDVDGNLMLVKIKGLTFEGSNFISDMRNDNIWNKVKSRAEKLGLNSIITLGEIAMKTVSEIIQ